MLSRYLIGRLCYYLTISLVVLNILFFIKIITELYAYIGVNNDSIWDMLLLLLYSVPFVNFQILPISLFIAAFLTVRQFSTGSEFVAMSSIGLSFRKIMLPVFVFSLVFVMIQAVVAFYAMPYYSSKLEGLKFKLARKVFISKLKPKIPNEIENTMVYFNRFTPEHDLKEVLIINPLEDTKVIQAEEMNIRDIILNRKLRFNFINGKTLTLDEKSNRVSEMTFKKLTIPIFLDAGIFDKLDIDANISDTSQSKFSKLTEKRRDFLMIHEVIYVLNHPDLEREDYFVYYSFIFEKVYFILMPFVFLLCVVAFAYTIPRVSDSYKKGILLLIFVIINYMSFSTLMRWSQKGLITPGVLFILPAFFFIFAVVMIYDIDHHFLVPVKLYFRKRYLKLRRKFKNIISKPDNGSYLSE